MNKIIKKIRNFIYKNYSQELSSKDKVLIAKNILSEKKLLSSINDLGDVEFSCFSQWGEDGIINWLISKLPSIPKKFIEFGVGNYKESNTRLLLYLHNWQGLVIDNSDNYIKDIKNQDISWRYELNAISSHITKDNINSMLEKNKMTSDIGLLSIDIDGNDYYVWRSIDIVRPVIVVVEYNAVLGDLHSITVPYNPSFFRTKAHYSNLYFGASLKALVDLGKKKGYTFIGTNTNGVNAFFVRNDHASEIMPLLSSVSAYPSRLREARGKNGELMLVSGSDRLEIIKDCQFFNLTTEENINIKKLSKIYSSEWENGERNNFK
tara:strand:- start:2181 stop:3143 length:963 start_codon:yes stop_codon:yes gene_type:complete